MHHPAPRDDGDVRALARDAGDAQRHEVLRVVRYLALDVVERLALHEEHRVIVADGRLEQPLRVGGRRGREHLEPRDVRVEVLHRVRVLRADLTRRGVGARSTMGMVNCPPDICRILAALLRIWSKATAEKFHVMYSTMGRRPTIAAPMEMPVKPLSVMGASMTRFGPNLSSMPSETL